MHDEKRHTDRGRWISGALVPVFLQPLGLGGVANAQIPEVTVVGSRDSEPIMQIDSEDLQSYGTSSIEELLSALAPRIQSSMSDDPPIILVNGRLAGQTELQNLPPEAVARVDVLPEVSALRYGFPDNRRVINLILREHFRTNVVEVADSQATEGGGQTGSGDASMIRIDHDTQTTVRADYKERERLLESQRDIDTSNSNARTLEPALHEAKLAATLARTLAGVRPLFEASVDTTSTDSLHGTAVTDSGLELLRKRTDATTAHVAGRLNGMAGGLNWTTVVAYDRTTEAIRGATGADAANGGLSYSDAHSSFDNVGVESSVGGPFLELPAGQAFMSADLNARLQDFDSSTQKTATPASSSHLSRTTTRLRLNTNFPLTNHSSGPLAALGDLAVRLNGSIEQVSSFGTLVSRGLGMTWQPRKLLTFNIDFSDRRTAPSVQNLFDPTVITPGVQTFDFVTDETAYVTTIAGGSPDLRNAETRGTTVGLYIGPYQDHYTFIATYQRRRTFDGIGAPPTTEAVELGFPDRFIRDGDGNLVVVDTRPLNLWLGEKDTLHWGVNLTPLPGRSSPKAPPAPLLTISAFDTWYLRDTLVIRQGVPELDFLNGAPTSVTASGVASTQTRHAVDLRVVFNYFGTGVLFNTAWHSPSEVDSGTTATATTLHFSALTTMDLRLFSSLGELPLTKQHQWAKGLRISLGASNLLNSHERVRNAAGATPLSFEPGYVDPLGRVVTLSVRKVF